MIELVYWRWSLCKGSLSRLHRPHPRYPQMTWCGTLAVAQPKYGIAEVFHTDKPPKRLEMCKECPRMHKPMKVYGWDEREVAA